MSQTIQSELLISLINLNNRIQKSLYGPLSCHGISVIEYFVLKKLVRAPQKKLRRIDLANEVGLTASGITRLLAPMEKTGLVSRGEAERDARVSLVSVTISGEQIFKDASLSFSQSASNFFQSLSSEEISALHKLTAKLT